MLKELIQLIKWLFSSNPSDCDELQIVQMKHFPFSGYSAMSWCGRLVTRKDPSTISEITKNHETIHLKQAQADGSWVKYYFKYLKEWAKGCIIMTSVSSAYYTIYYEMEAYANEEDFSYIKNYDIKNIEKYKIKNRKETYKKFGSVREWKKYIKTL